MLKDSPGTPIRYYPIAVVAAVTAQVATRLENSALDADGGSHGTDIFGTALSPTLGTMPNPLVGLKLGPTWVRRKEYR